MARPHPVLVSLAAGRQPDATRVDDPGLLASAIDHGMHGLLWTWVRDVAPGFPERIRLGGLAAATRQRHDCLWSTSTAVRDRLAAVGIETIALKGVTAEARWYERPGERPSTDVDVLLPPHASARAGEVLRALDPRHPLVDAIADVVASGTMQAVSLLVDGVPVDLHFDLLKLGYPLRAPGVLWDRAQPHVCPDGSLLRVLCAEHALVHFLVHANKDSFPRLLGYADVVRIMGGDLDWDLVARLVRTEGLDDVAACALATITGALGLPPSPLAAPGGLRTAAWRVVWPDRVTLLGSAGTSRSRRQEALPFLVRGRGLDAARAAVGVVFPPSAAVARRYPDIPGPYLVRLARGRGRTMAGRHRSLRARRARRDVPGAAVPLTDGATKARLLRARLARAPLWLEVSGGSMGWSIPGGGRVRVEEAHGPGRGEVWAFCATDGRVVVHRARGVSAGAGPTYRFQGDACVRPDEPVTRDRLIGRVVEIDPPRPSARWGPAAGAVQRMPRVAVATVVRAGRRVRGQTRDLVSR